MDSLIAEKLNGIFKYTIGVSNASNYYTFVLKQVAISEWVEKLASDKCLIELTAKSNALG